MNKVVVILVIIVLENVYLKSKLAECLYDATMHGLRYCDACIQRDMDFYSL